MTDTPNLHRLHPQTDDEWLFVARVFRDALQVVLPTPTIGHCLPGEERACGADALTHILKCSAALAAMGLHLAEHEGPARVTQFFNLFDTRRLQLDGSHPRPTVAAAGGS